MRLNADAGRTDATVEETLTGLLQHVRDRVEASNRHALLERAERIRQQEEAHDRRDH